MRWKLVIMCLKRITNTYVYCRNNKYIYILVVEYKMYTYMYICIYFYFTHFYFIGIQRTVSISFFHK